MRWLLLLIPVLVIVAGYGLHRLALWAEGRGWIYYKTKRAPAGAGSLAMLEVAQILEPEVQQVIEAVQSDREQADHEESGEGRPAA
jgi:hypothetical protein